MNSSVMALATVLAGCSVGISAVPDGAPVADAPTACEALPLPPLSVAKSDLYGYPPYAMDGCQLAYVSSNGNLMLRALHSGSEEVVASASEHPRRPSLKDGAIAWEGVNTSGKSVVRVRSASLATVDMVGAFDHAGEPRLGGGALVFTAWKTADDLGDSEVDVYDLSTKATIALDGNGQQRFADVSDAHVLYSDFGEDPDGTFNGNKADVADVVIYDRASRTSVTRKLVGKQAFPRVASGTAMIYLSWNLIHPEPKMNAYELMTGPISANVANDAEVAFVTNDGSASYILPSVQNGIVEWIGQDVSFAMRLWRTRLDQIAPVAVTELDGLSLAAPVAHPQFTLLAVQKSGSDPELRLLTR